MSDYVWDRSPTGRAGGGGRCHGIVIDNAGQSRNKYIHGAVPMTSSPTNQRSRYNGSRAHGTSNAVV